MNRRFIFAGNRFFVLDEMLKMGLNVTQIFAAPGSRLEKELYAANINFNLLHTPKDFFQLLGKFEYDVFLSNGCPIILPTSLLESRKANTKFVNIHPSFLPNLRGADPVPGALLYGQESGATCHIIDSGIDTGPIIAQIKVDYSFQLTAPVLYQLSFIAEVDVFRKSFSRNFEPSFEQNITSPGIYYSRKDEDQELDFRDDAISLAMRIKAFGNASKGAYFWVNNKKFTVFDVELVECNFIKETFSCRSENTIVLIAEDQILIKKTPFLLLKRVVGDFTCLSVGDSLEAQ